MRVCFSAALFLSRYQLSTDESEIGKKSLKPGPLPNLGAACLDAHSEGD
jgi:hypothetical protein